MIRKVFILVPSPHPAGPIKGAYALANAIARHRNVTLVTLKTGPGADAPLDSSIVRISLDARSGWAGWVREYRSRLKAAGGRDHVASISLCCSADLVNRFCAREAVICSSVRGNLLQNYRLDYGPAGAPWALFHLAALRRFDHVIAMTDSMARQVERYARKTPAVIGNFVDEDALEGYRTAGPAQGPLRFVFLGSLTRRKQPLLLLEAVRQLIDEGVPLKVDIVGDGPMRQGVADAVERLSIREVVQLHGYSADPYHLLAKADALVLPSISEGVSRASLEALHLGVPCVLRDADGNAELLTVRGGTLFRKDDELAAAMLSAARMARGSADRPSLLPAAFRQQSAVERYLELIERH